MCFTIQKLIILSGFFGLISSVWGQSLEIDFILDHQIFEDIKQQPYLETHLYVDSRTLHYKKDKDGLFRSRIQIQTVLTQGEEIKVNEQSILESKGISDTLPLTLSSAHQLDTWRKYLSPGRYTLSVTLLDLQADSSSKVTAVREFEIKPVYKDSVAISDLLFYINKQQSNQQNTLTRADGKDYIPLVTNSTFILQDTLKAYLEVYRTASNTNKPYFITASILQANSNRQLEQYTQTFRKNPSEFDMLNITFPIRELSSQTYQLKIEMFNYKNEIVTQKTFKFFLFNDRVASEELLTNINAFDQKFGYDENQLNQYIEQLRFISTAPELSFAQVLKTYEEKKNYFYAFWEARKSEPTKYTKITEWQSYKSLIDYANQKYKSKLRAGWKTDRGRIMLQYGAPNDVQQYPSMNNTAPYEIWTYNKLGVQPQVIFVFVDKDLITNEYPLVHSTKYGEANNPRWRLDQLSRFQDANTVDYDNLDRDKNLRREFNDVTPR